MKSQVPLDFDPNSQKKPLGASLLDRDSDFNSFSKQDAAAVINFNKDDEKVQTDQMTMLLFESSLVAGVGQGSFGHQSDEIPLDQNFTNKIN